MKRFILILIWLWLTMALLALFAQPLHVGAGLSRLIEESKLFFILIAFPFTLRTTETSGVIPATPNGILINESSVGKAGIQTPYLLDCLKSFIIFILLSLPLTIMALHSGDTDWSALLRANLLLLLMTLFIAILFPGLQERYQPVYYLAAFILYGVGPILYYLVLELSGASWNALIMINPFRLFWQIGRPEIFNPAWLVQCLIWVALIIIIVTSYRIIKKKS